MHYMHDLDSFSSNTIFVFIHIKILFSLCRDHQENQELTEIVVHKAFL